MEQFIKKWIIIFKHMTIQEQLNIFLLFLTPFLIFIIIQLTFQALYKKYRIKRNFNKIVKVKNLNERDVNFFKNFLNYLDQPIRAEFLEYNFQYWRLVFMYSHRAIERKENILKSLQMIKNLKELGKKLYGQIPDRYFSTRDFPPQIEVTLGFSEINRKNHAFLTSNEDDHVIFLVKELPTFYTSLSPGSRVEIILIDQTRGLYFIQCSIKTIGGNDHNLLYLNHSIHVLFRNLRRYERLSLDVPVEMKDMDLKYFRYQKILKGYFIDISRGGAKIISDQTLNKGESYLLCFRFNEKSIELPAMIVELSYNYQRRSEAYHFKFVKFTQKNKAALSMILFKLKAEKT